MAGEPTAKSSAQPAGDGLPEAPPVSPGWSIWVYATSGEPNVAAHAQADWTRGVSTMGLIYFAVFSVPLALAFISPTASMIIYGAIVLLFIGFTVVGKGEAVVVWRTARTR